jgi:hypothetical protein
MINVIVIVLDITLLSCEFTNLYIIETTFKEVVYSIKLMLEFAVLDKLVQFKCGNGNNCNCETQRSSIWTDDNEDAFGGTPDFVISSPSLEATVPNTVPQLTRKLWWRWCGNQFQRSILRYY